MVVMTGSQAATVQPGDGRGLQQQDWHHPGPGGGTDPSPLPPYPPLGQCLPPLQGPQLHPSKQL